MDIKETYKYQREWQKENYKSISINVPKSWEIPIKARAKMLNKSTNEYIRDMIEQDIAQYYKNLTVKPDSETGQDPSTKQ